MLNDYQSTIIYFAHVYVELVTEVLKIVSGHWRRLRLRLVRGIDSWNGMIVPIELALFCLALE